jgi:putative Ca2+/H+ antiporter (TMEM165/GDT1 family)
MVHAVHAIRHADCRLGETIGWVPIHMAGVGAQSMRSRRPACSSEKPPMEAFFVSTAIVAIAEMGDKTQLLALVLAARFRKPWPIVLGILAATLANHALAGAVGAWVTTFMGPQVLRWVLGACFIAMAIWMLIPDKLDEDETATVSRWGVFGTTLVAFFLAEMGDKTQIATVVLAAKYNAYLWVVAGTTLGMMLANAPVVWLGERITRLVPLRIVHMVSAAIFLVLGALALWAPGVDVLA